jgi:NitT/TauT family transport system substrate-binding protein
MLTILSAMKTTTTRHGRAVLTLWLGLMLLVGVGAVHAQDDVPEPCSGVIVPDAADAPVAPPEDLREITLFLGYIPNVQFAPLYVADAKGYFAEAGVDVVFEYGDENIGVERLATGDLQFAVLSGEQVVLARGRDFPLVYTFEWYQRFAVGVVAPVDANITAPADMAGKVIGIPGRFGASWLGFSALLHAADLTESDLAEIKPIGFAATEVLCAGQADGAVVYISNEPEQIRAACSEVDIIPIADYADLVANGLVTNEYTVAKEPALVRGMVSAFARGLADTLADPDEAYTLSRDYVETLDADDPIQQKVLENSLALWDATALGGAQLGYTDPASWTLTMQTLLDMELLEEPVDLSGACTNALLPPAED